MSGFTTAFREEIIDTVQRSPLILTRCVDRATVARLSAWVDQLCDEDWQAGDGSGHSWTEHHFNTEALSRLCSEVPILGALGKHATSTVAWVNRFRHGEWIASHRDAGGDLQCIVPIAVPASCAGGQLWIGSPGQVVPALPGDVIVFNAAGRAHGTSTITAASAQRVTLNIRYWLPSAPPEIPTYANRNGP